MRSLLHSLIFLVTQTLATRHIVIVNQCPSAINLYTSGVLQQSLPANGGQTTRDVADTFSDFFYTDVNGGNANGVGTTRAGFYGPIGNYYAVVDPNYFNIGVSIRPNNVTSSNGYCATDECDTITCSAFHFPPTRIANPPDGSAPLPPMFSCAPAGTGFTITFCPNHLFPAVANPPKPNHPMGSPNKCMDVRGAIFANGTPVQVYNCNGTPAQEWIITKYNTKVQLAGTNFCLDAGSAPANGVGMKIWQCFDNLPAQAWYFTEDDRIALTNEGFCLDVPNGNLANSQRLQTWRCADNNVNQVFELFTP